MIASATAKSELAGLSILIVEDDYYQATDTQRILEGAGAKVIGPCGRPEEALDLIESQHPDCALIDINLGDGPSFAAAYRLVERKIPFLVVSGYDDVTMPDELLHVPRLEKPVEGGQLIDAIRAVMQEMP